MTATSLSLQLFITEATRESSARNPAVLPECTRQYSWIADPEDRSSLPDWCEAIELPADLRSAVPKRQYRFRAGRFCALQALRALEPHRAVVPIPRTASGAPRWPAGITGSITHTDDFVSAAVARTSQLVALGIDTERIMSAERARSVSPAVAWPYELALARRTGCDRLEALTLVFCAKESIFKCLRPCVPGFFDYRDVRVVDVDARDRTFVARIVRTLSERFPAQTILEGRFEIAAPWIHAGIAFEAER